MEAEIKDEIEEGVGLTVDDHLGMGHRMVVGYEGEIKAHKTDGYPKPSERTHQEDDVFSQARRFAQWHVYREKGYDTVPNTANPDRIAAVLMALLDLDDEKITEYFGTLYEQAVSHDRTDVSPPLDLPTDVYNERFLIYKQNIYLEEDLETIQQQLQRPATEIIAAQEREELATATGDGLREKITSLVGGSETTSDETEWTTLTIDGVSGIDTMYYEDTNDDRTIEGEDPFDRGPDARLEIVPAAFDRDRFRYHLGHNLVCQIRDCFIGMGVEPPEPYRVLGHGQYKYTGKYRHFDFYEDYWDHDANVPGYVSPL